MSIKHNSPMNRVAIAILGALFISGCITSIVPPPITNFLSGGDQNIADVIREAAADWARHGLDIANYVTVDDVGEGMPVRFASDEEFSALTDDDTSIGLTGKRKGKWFMILFEELRTNPDKLLHTVKHELIHALVPRASHTPAPGVFNEKLVYPNITRADMEHLSKFTKVVPSEAPFTGEETA